VEYRSSDLKRPGFESESAHKEREMTDAKIDTIVREAIEALVKAKSTKEPTTPCLSDETIRSICEGTLPDSRRASVIEHLRECRQCCDDLTCYFDLLEATEETPVQERSGKRRIAAEDRVSPAAAWDRLDRALEYLRVVLSGCGFLSGPQKQTDESSLMTEGYAFSVGRRGGRKTTTARGKGTISRSRRDKARLAQGLHSLLEIFVDEAMPVSAKEALVKELLLLARKAYDEYGRKPSTTRKARSKSSEK